MTTWWFGRRSCMRKEQIWAVMCNDPSAVIHSLPPCAPACLVESGGLRASCWCRAQTQKFTTSLCLAALPAPLFTASLYNHWCCTGRSCKIQTPGTQCCVSWDICRANPAPTKGFTDATAVTDTLMFHKQMWDRSLMSWFQSLQFFAPQSHYCWHFQLLFLFTCKLTFSFFPLCVKGVLFLEKPLRMLFL